MSKETIHATATSSAGNVPGIIKLPVTVGEIDVDDGVIFNTYQRKIPMSAVTLKKLRKLDSITYPPPTHAGKRKSRKKDRQNKLRARR